VKGKIIKGIGGFYYVKAEDEQIYECKAKGIFRKRKITPLIGDDVIITLLDKKNKLGNVDKILPRRTYLHRPMVANIDQAVIVFSLSQPELNRNLLDRFLVMVEEKDIEAVICLNKTDIVSKKQVEDTVALYKKIGYHIIPTSWLEQEGIEALRDILENKTTVFAGPSGVGKSSILNLIQSEIKLETGILSKKIGRGKHTTRHVELIAFKQDSYVVDTPGFSSLNIDYMEQGELKYYFREFAEYAAYCRFKSCQHIKEPICGVKQAVEDGNISKSRYLSYQQLFTELESIRRW